MTLENRFLTSAQGMQYTFSYCFFADIKFRERMSSLPFSISAAMDKLATPYKEYKISILTLISVCPKLK